MDLDIKTVTLESYRPAAITVPKTKVKQFKTKVEGDDEPAVRPLKYYIQRLTGLSHQQGSIPVPVLLKLVCMWAESIKVLRLQNGTGTRMMSV